MGENEYRIQLGIGLDDADFNNIKSKINGLEDEPIKIRLDTKTVDNQIDNIKKELQGLSSDKGSKNILTLDTTSLESSLKDVSTTIKDIRSSLGTLDKKSGMKSLLSSINQISTALEKASNQFESLNANLNAFSGKDLNLNFGITMGGSNPIARNSEYGSKVRNETLPQLKKQVAAIQKKLLEHYQKVLKDKTLSDNQVFSKLIWGTPVLENSGTDIYSLYGDMSSTTLKTQMQAYKQYINLMKEAAKIKGIDLSDATSQFSKSADQLVQDAIDVQTGAKEMDDAFEKLKNIFGGGNNLNVEGISAQLDSIVADLGEIKTAIQGLSSGISLEGLTNSFDRLSETIEKLVSNVTLAKNALGDGLSSTINANTGSVNKIEKASDDSTAAIIQNEKKKQEAYKATADTVMYHAGVISKLNKAETNGRFYGSNRGTGYFGTGHYFVDSATKHELDESYAYSKLPYTSIDISQYDNLFDATNNEVAGKLHDFLRNLTRFTQGSDNYDVSDLFEQFKDVFGDTIMDIKEFGSRVDQLKTFMSNSNFDDRSDSVSTQFMKSLGYGGVDTRGTDYADTRYGTVIYDLKEESILQANITDELQKQGQMLEKINYAKGQVFDKDADARIQQQLDEQAKRKEIADEFTNSFDTTNFDKAEADLINAKNRIEKIDGAISHLQNSLNNLDQEYQDSMREWKNLGFDDIFLIEDEEDWKKDHAELYQSSIDELSKEKAELQSKIPVLEEVYNRENQLSQNAYEQAKRTVEQRHLEAQQAQEAANTIVQSEEKKQQAIKQTDAAIDSLSSEKTTNIGLESIKSDISQVTAVIDNADHIIKGMQRALNDLGVGFTGADTVTQDIQKMGIEVQKVTTRIKGNNLEMSITGVQQTADGIQRVVTEIKRYENAVENTKGIDKVFTQSFETSDDKLKKEVKEVNEAYSEIYAIKKKIGSLEVDLVSAKAKDDKKTINDINNEIARLKSNLESLDIDGIYSSRFTDAQKADLKELNELIEYSKKQAQNKVDYKLDLDNAKKEVKEVNEDFKKLISLAKRMGDVDIQLGGLNDVNKESEKFNSLKRLVDGLEVEYKELYDSIGSKLDASQIKELDQIFANTTGAVRELNIEMAKSEGQKELTSGLEKLKSMAREINGLKIDIFKFEDVDNIEKASNRLNELENEASELRAVLQQKFPATAFSEIDDIARQGEQALDALIAKAAEAKVKLANDIILKIDSDKFDDDISKINEKFNKLSKEPEELTNSIRDVKNALSEMEKYAGLNDDDAVDVEKLVQAYKKYEQALKSVNNQLRIQLRAEQADIDFQKLTEDRNVFQSKIDAWLTKNSAATKKFGNSMRNLQAQAKNCDRITLNKLLKQFARLDYEADKAGLKMQSLGDRIKSKFKEYSAYFSVAEVFMYITQGLKDMFEQVKAVDTAMTELKKVTNETDTAYDSFLNNAASRAKEIGTTVDGLITSTADFARLGYGFGESQELAEVANIYAVVGDEIDSVDTATKSLISTMTAFGVEASDSMSIVDKFNEIGNNFAISSGGIGEALERSASSMAAANNSLDETIALITAANTVVQDPDAVGTAFKTISMRIRGAKTDLEDAGLDTEGMASSTAKLREEIKALSGVDIMLNNNEFKSTYKIIEELAAKWQDLTDIQQASITELIAGKRQGNIISSLMENFDIADRALQTSLNSSGSAMEEHGKYMDSLEAKLSQLKAAWQSFALTFMDSSLLKGGVDVLKDIVGAVEWLVDNFGLLGTIGLGAGIGGLFNHFKGAKEAKKTITDVVKAVDNLTDVMSNATNAATEAAEATSNVASASTEVVEAAGNTASTVTEATEATTNLASASTEATEASANLASTTTEVSEATANMASTTTEAVEATGNLASASTEAAEAMANTASAATETAEAMANMTSAGTEAAETTANLASGASEFVEAAGNTASIATETTETVVNLGGAAVEAGADAVKAAGGFKKFFGTLGGKLAIAGAVVAALGLLYNQYKKTKEAAAEARQEAIESSSEYLDAATSFEHAYIKYSGRTDLTTAEEADLESAIQGTVDALNDKSSALQGVVNNSNDYLASLEAIKDEELEAAKNAATTKRDNAANQLKEAAIGWETFDGSEVNISFGTNGASEEAKIAEKIGSEYWAKHTNTGKAAVVTYSLQLDPNASVDEIIEYYDFLKEYQAALSEDGLGNTEVFKQVEVAIGKMSEAIGVYIDGTYEAAKAQYQLDNGIPKTTDEYIAMREAILGSDGIKNSSLNTKMSILNTLDSEYGQLFDLSSAEAQARKFVGIIKGYGDGTKDGTDEIGTVETFLNMRTALNNNECTVGEYLSELDNITSMSEKFSDEEKKQFNLAYGLDTDSIKKQYDDVYNYISRNYLGKLNTTGMSSFDASEYKAHEEQKIKDILNSLSASELQAVANIKGEINWETTNTDQILAQIKEEAKFLEAMNYTIAIDVETESLDALNSALSESVSGAGLSSDSIMALKGRYAELASQGYDLSAMFEETSNGIHLNKNAVSEFEQALASQKLSETDDKLETLKDRYNDLTTQIETCTDAGERAHLYSEQQEVAQKINDLATLASQYKGLTSAYNAWQNAESAGNERDMYESIIEGFENIGDEISRGWYDDGTIQFLELITGETDLAGKSATELKEIWKSLDDTIKGTSYSVKDFFTTNEDGESTNTGAYNFLKAVEQLGKNGKLKFENGKTLNDLITRKDGKKDGAIVGFDFNVVGGDKAVADALGISEEMVQIIQRALDDAGFVVTLDGSYTQLADLQTNAEKASNSLKKLKSEGLDSLKDVDLNFDFNVDTVQGYQEQLEKAAAVLDKFRDKNGKLKTDKNGNLVEGAKEALEIAEYYTAAMDKLTEPKFMQIDTSTVDDELQEPIEKIQTIGDLCKEKHLVSLTGDTEDLKEVQGEIDKVAKEIEKLDPEVKAKIGIDEDWDAKTIADKIEKGEIEVPAELKLDVQMSEDLKDMRLLMMRQLGLVSEEEVKLKVGYEIDESTVDDLTPDEQKVVVEFIAENEDWFDKLTDDEKKVAIELVTSGVDLDSLTDDEKKEVVVEFVTKNEDEFDKLSDEEKQVVVDLVADDKALKALEEHGVEIEAFCNIFGVEKVDDLKAKLDKLDDKQIQVLTKVLGQIDVEKLKTTVAGLDDKTVEAIAKALGEGDVNGLKTTINGLDDKTVQAIAQALGYSDVNELNSAIDNLDPKTVQAIAQALGITDVDSLRNAINRLTNKDVEAAATVSGKDDVNSLKSAIDNLKGKTVTVWASIKKKASSLWDKLTGGGGVDGTAHVNGTAFADGTVIRKSGKAFKQGDWGTKDSGVALGGEEAPELLVRNGRWHLIGEKGAEFFGYRKGDIIFNASQTKEIFEKGKITHGNGRGKALVSGTAFSSGSGGGEEITIGVNKNTGASYTKSTDKDDFEETIDWIETAIDRIERAIDQLDTKANSTYRSWSERNSSLAKQISKVSDEIALQQSAYEEYMAAANAVGLSSSYAAKVRNGTIDIETIKDEGLKAKIDDYENWYSKALDCKDAILELQEAESSLFAQRFENIQTQYDGILQGYEHTETMLNEYISQAEEQGYIVSKKYYQALINNEKSNIAELKKEQSDLIKMRDEAVASGTITKYSEEWYNMCAEIDSVTQAIEESTTALLEFDNAIRDIDWQIFDLIQERISDITAESEFLIELMSNKDLFDDNGKFTERGVATVGLHALNYNTSMYQADDYGKEVAKLDKQIAKDPYDQELINRRRELLELQRESILAAEDEKNAIRDLVEEGINLELDALQERIDLHNEELDSMKDLYDYQKNVEEQTENIASLRKQLGAYEGFDDEETRAKVQELKVSLEEAEADLQETEYDKFISDQTALLDTLYTEYETILNSRLDNIDFLLEQVIDGINAAAGAEGTITSALGADGAIAAALGSNATTIGETLKTEVGAVGTKLSTAMNNIWLGDGSGKAVLDLYGKDFQNRSTTANEALNKIKTDVNAMVDDVDKDAQKKVVANKTATSAQKNPTTTTNANKNNTTTNNNSSSKPTVTDDTIKGIAASIWVYGDGSGWGNNPFRENKLSNKIGADNAKKVQDYINKHGSNGDLYNFWVQNGKNLDKYKYSAFKSGARLIDESQLAWTQEGHMQEFIVRPSDGAILTPVAKGDSVLNAAASNNIWQMANSPAEFIKDNLGIGSANVPSAQNVNNNITQHFENITFSMPNVHGYNDLLTEMQRDPKFEKLVLSMTIDRVAGKSSLAKGKSIR